MLAIVSVPTLAFLSASRMALPGTPVQSENPMQSDARPRGRRFGFNISQQIRTSWYPPFCNPVVYAIVSIRYPSSLGRVRPRVQMISGSAVS